MNKYITTIVVFLVLVVTAPLVIYRNLDQRIDTVIEQVNEYLAWQNTPFNFELVEFNKGLYSSDFVLNVAVKDSLEASCLEVVGTTTHSPLTLLRLNQIENSFLVKFNTDNCPSLDHDEKDRIDMLIPHGVLKSSSYIGFSGHRSISFESFDFSHADQFTSMEIAPLLVQLDISSDSSEIGTNVEWLGGKVLTPGLEYHFPMVESEVITHYNEAKFASQSTRIVAKDLSIDNNYAGNSGFKQLNFSGETKLDENKTQFVIDSNLIINDILVFNQKAGNFQAEVDLQGIDVATIEELNLLTTSDVMRSDISNAYSKALLELLSSVKIDIKQLSLEHDNAKFNAALSSDQPPMSIQMHEIRSANFILDLVFNDEFVDHAALIMTGIQQSGSSQQDIETSAARLSAQFTDNLYKAVQEGRLSYESPNYELHVKQQDDVLFVNGKIVE